MSGAGHWQVHGAAVEELRDPETRLSPRHPARYLGEVDLGDLAEGLDPQNGREGFQSDRDHLRKMDHWDCQ